MRDRGCWNRFSAARVSDDEGVAATARRTADTEEVSTVTAIALTPKRLDVAALELKVKAMYRDVALDPHGEFHFEMGRALAERLGYAPADLDAIPPQAIDSFAGVGYYFDLAALAPGETVAISAAVRGWTASSPRSRWARKGA
jgi:hypothetical protein